MKMVNEAIQAKHPHVEIVYGKGYFYLHSKDDATALYIAGMYDVSISVYRLNHLSLEQWVSSVDYLFENDRNKR